MCARSLNQKEAIDKERYGKPYQNHLWGTGINVAFCCLPYSGWLENEIGQQDHYQKRCENQRVFAHLPDIRKGDGVDHAHKRQAKSGL